MLSARQVCRLLIGFALIGILYPTPANAQRRLSFRRGTTAPQLLFNNTPTAVGSTGNQHVARQLSPDGSLVRPAQSTTEEFIPSVMSDVQSLDGTLEDVVVEGDGWTGEGLVGEHGIGHDSCGCANCAGHGSLLNGFISHLSLFGGSHAFRNDANRGADASFGFHYGVNFGGAAKNIILPRSVGWQIGAQFANSNLNASSFTFDERSQVFVTAGLYRRGDFGLQGGLAFDYMWDNWYYAEKLNVGQARGEIGLATTPATTLGFEFAASVQDHTVNSRLLDGDELNKWKTKDQFRFFYRTRMFAGGRGECHLFAGFSGHSDGIIGGKSKVPLHNGWALETDYTYLIPSESKRNGANENESWNIAFNLAWYPGSLACGDWNRDHRPLFDVANNGSMILRRVID